MKAAPALSAVDLSYAYPDGRKAVDRVCLEVGEGESVGLVGPNGAGKTTLLLALAGLLEPCGGEVRVFGHSFGGPEDLDARRALGFLFQETDDQLFSTSVFDDVAFGPVSFSRGRIGPEALRDRVKRALDLVGLPGFEARVPHHLSSGERRRVALASVLSYEPRVLILDEPSNDLDPRGRRELAQLLARGGLARLVASHDLEFVLRTCTRVLLMTGGRIAADGDAIELLTDRALLERHDLESPLGLDGSSAARLREILERDRDRAQWGTPKT